MQHYHTPKGMVLLLALAVLLLAATAGPLPLAAQGSTPVFINEIHYDNDGTDEGEAIEIAGPAGTDLTDWSLVLYNGNGGTTYNTTPLSGVIPDQQDGYGTVVIYPAVAIQNGSPDGMALVDDGGAVVQFLSYEGTIDAANGPAMGMTSTDIGVAQLGTPVGYSLQLSGTGLVYEDFTWNAAAPNTFGAVNTGQTFAASKILTVSKAAPTTVTPGEQFDYTITVVNVSGLTLTDLVLTDTVPANATFVSASDGGVLDGGVVEWTVTESVGPGDSVVRTFQVTATETNGVQIVNDDYGADVTGMSAPEAGSPVTTHVFEETPTDIEVTKSGPHIAALGDTLSYTLVVSNTSTEDAASVVLTDTLPAGLIYGSDDIGPHTSPSAGVYVWNLGDLPAGSSQTLHVNVGVDAGTPTGTPLVNRVEVGTATNELDEADNAGEWTTTVYELVTIAEARQREGDTVMVEGVVTAEPGIFVDGTNRKMYMQDDTAGILVYRGGGLDPVARSNKVRVAGEIKVYAGETEIVPAGAGDVLDLGPDTPVTPAALDTGAVDESVEGELIQVFGQIVAKTVPYRLDVDDGSGQVQVYRYVNLGTATDPNYIDTSSYQVGDWIRATGVSLGYESGGNVTREVMPRGPDDVQEFYVVTFVYHDVEDVVLPGEDVGMAADWNGWGSSGLEPMVANAAHSVFTATVTLDAPGPQQYAYIVESGGQEYAGWLNSNLRSLDVQGSPTVDDYRLVVPDEAVLQEPPAITINLGEATGPITGDVSFPSLTGEDEAGRALWGELGYGTGTDPAAWTWTPMSYTGPFEDAFDRFAASLQPEAGGVYRYAVRFDGNRGPGNPNAGWTYGDLDVSDGSFELDQTGVLTVTAPSLSVAKVVAPEAGVLPGGTVTYTITLSNTGDGLATGIVLTDALPEEVSFGGWIVQGDATESDGTIRWTGDLEAGASVTIAFTATVGTDPALSGATVTNSASFTSANAGSGTAGAAFQLQGKVKIFLPLIHLDSAD